MLTAIAMIEAVQPAMQVNKMIVVAMIAVMATVWSGFWGTGVGVSFISAS
jgi:hypothetical protein